MRVVLQLSVLLNISISHYVKEKAYQYINPIIFKNPSKTISSHNHGVPVRKAFLCFGLILLLRGRNSLNSVIKCL